MSDQARLLRVLELGEVPQVIAATNRDLRAELAAGRFRSDLYYRLNNVEVKLPPLRERREDIPYLTAAFVRDMSERLHKPLVGLTPGAERILSAAPWDGNVRELRNVIERLVILTPGDVIDAEDVKNCLGAPTGPAPGGLFRPGVPFRVLSEEAERVIFEEALTHFGGSVAATAKGLGMDRSYFYKKTRTLGVRGAKGDGEDE